MLLFRSEEHIDQWCAQSGEPRGESMSMETIWELAKAWYHPRLEMDFHGRSTEQAEAMFASVGLNSPFWRF